MFFRLAPATAIAPVAEYEQALVSALYCLLEFLLGYGLLWIFCSRLLLEILIKVHKAFLLGYYVFRPLQEHWWWDHYEVCESLQAPLQLDILLAAVPPDVGEGVAC